jgi:hypothetical protein
VFYDRQPLTGVNYYRLNQVDLDGKGAYSRVAKLNFAEQLTIQINPNPAHGTANIQVKNGNGGLSLLIVDMNGQLVQQRITTAGEQTIPIDISGLAKGIYTVKVIGQTTLTTQKLLVQ